MSNLNRVLLIACDIGLIVGIANFVNAMSDRNVDEGLWAGFIVFVVIAKGWIERHFSESQAEIQKPGDASPFPSFKPLSTTAKATVAVGLVALAGFVGEARNEATYAQRQASEASDKAEDVDDEVYGLRSEVRSLESEIDYHSHY